MDTHTHTHTHTHRGMRKVKVIHQTIISCFSHTNTEANYFPLKSSTKRKAEKVSSPFIFLMLVIVDHRKPYLLSYANRSLLQANSSGEGNQLFRVDSTQRDNNHFPLKLDKMHPLANNVSTGSTASFVCKKPMASVLH